ncbi:MAG: hypothetical protein JW940_20060 [Polyangiaceae bacterium]|nr:hypothetical protein [Polyangiaceae bacterium]
MAYTIVVGGFTVVCAAQIIYQVWGPREGTPPPVDCHTGVKRLVLAVRRARHAGETEARGERAAVARFRDALRPEWDWRASLGRTCQGDRTALRALGDTDRLRYAEEHAVRYESVDLARRRRRVGSLGRWAPTTARSPESSSGR